MIVKTLKAAAKRTLPPAFRRWLKQSYVRTFEVPPYKCVRFGSFRRTTPIHSGFSTGRGNYIDRYYIERYLQCNATCIKGRVLELGKNEYTVKFGGSHVIQSDILDVRPDHTDATIIADLSTGEGIPSDAFDCIILTQVLNFIYDLRGSIQTLHRVLKPGGCVLVSVSGIAQIAQEEVGYCGDYWRFTSMSLRRLFEEVFSAEDITVESQGNVLAAIAFLHGLAWEELRTQDLDRRDPNFEVSILLKALKAAR